MDGIYNATDDFPFSKLILLKPTSISGGNYFIKFRLNEKPLYIQTPKCNTKNGILKAGKKYYSDLMFTNEHESFIQWMEKLENYCQKYIYDNKATWFDSELEMHDIENSFSSCFKLYKSGKYYIVRSYVPTQLGSCSLKIYNENEELIDHTEINDKNDIITILEIQGIKCSARSFQIEIEIKQMLVLRPANLFEKCILSSGHAKSQSSVLNTRMHDYNSISSTDYTNNHAMAIPEIETIKGEQHEEIAQESSVDVRGPFILQKSSVVSPEKLPIPTLVPSSGNATIARTPYLGTSVGGRGLSGDDISSQDKARIEKISGETSSEFHRTEKYIEKSVNNSLLQNNDKDLGKLTQTNIISQPSIFSEPNNITDSYELKEIDFSLDEIPESEHIQIKTRNDVYYKMYQDAKQKAKMAKALALSSYMEAKRIKNTYMLEDLDDSDSDLDEDTIPE